jgi:tetratricopeptide (TPR) repeat protein
MTRKIFLSLFLSAVALGSSVFAQAQKSTDIDVQHYKIDAELIPASQLLRSRAEVTFVPQAETRSVVFEMNGSLTVSRITLKSGTALATTAPAAPAGAVRQLTSAPPQRAGQRPKPGAAQPQPDTAAGLQFIQDNRENMNVRIDLGSVVPARQPVTLVFEYEGALESAQGGPIQNARLAYVGEQGSYLTYAARWFPFHEYAGDRSTYQIALTVPKGVVVAGYSETPVAAAATTPGEVKDPETGKASKVERSVFTFTSTKPVLPGNFAAAKYIVKPFNFAGLTVEVFSKAGDERYAERVAEIVGKRLEYYSSKFGPYAFGNRIAVAETDEETLESYVGAGTIFLTPPAFATGNEDKLARDVAYQWWGQAVGIKSFDDIWLSQGLAQFSALLYYKDNGSETQFQQAIQAEMEKALAFEQSASIRNAPKQLDDQTPAYRSVVFNKGALVFNMLRQLMGEQKFDAMLRDYYVKFGGRNPTLEEFEAYVSKAAGRNLRSFFGQWVDSTGVPEFRAEYRMLRTKEGFRVPGTVKQELEAFEMPVEILLRTEAGMERETVLMKGTSVDFDIQTKSKPVEVIIDPDAKIMRSSDELRQAVVVRRGIEHFREQEYTEAEQQFNAAIKLNRGNSWAWYNLGILYMTQRNYQKALDAFDQAVNGSLKPDWIEVWSYIYRGNAWDAIDQRERALADYKKAVDNGNNYDNAQAVAQKYIEQKFDPKAAKPAV